MLKGLGPNNVYSDIDLDFIRHPITSDVPVKRDMESVKRSLRNLILYNRYEKPFNPEIFTGLRSLLFENTSPIFLAVMETRIKELIRNYEPRIDQLGVDVSPVEDEYQLNITIRFTTIALPEVEEVSFTLERIR
jgi:predicted component of type VI protein secretion system